LLTLTLSVDRAFADFINTLHYTLEHVVCYRTVTVRERDPLYITPPIKVLRRRRPGLRLHSLTEFGRNGATLVVRVIPPANM